MQSQVKPLTVVRLATENIRCSLDSCEALASLELGEQPFCPIHFFPACTQELESWNDALRNQPFDAAGSEQFKGFAAACAEYAQELEKDERFADARLKPLLLEFLLRISQLTRRLRRSPRMKLAVPVWLRREDSSRTWEEATWTTTVSRHGASLKCHHPVQTGGTVVLCRKDGGLRAEARVVYFRYDLEGQKEIGVELLDQTDIWGLGKNAS
jgi:PilZ domain